MRFALIAPAMFLLLVPAFFAQADTVPAAPTGQGVVLRYKYTTGEALKYHLTVNSDTTVSMGNQPIASKSSGSGDMEYTVQSIDASGNATIHSDVPSFNMTMSMNGQNVPLPSAASDLLKQGATVVMSPTGKLVSRNMGSSTTGAGMGIGQFMNSSTMGNMSLLPDHPVKIGDVWRGTAAVGTTGGQMYTKMALLALDTSGGHTVATIATRTEVDMPVPNPAGGTASTVKMMGTGKTKFDVDSGTLVSTTMTMSSDTAQTLGTGVASPGMGAMKMHMTIDTGMQLVGQ